MIFSLGQLLSHIRSAGLLFFILNSLFTFFFVILFLVFFFFSSRRRHTRSYGDWSSDVCSSDLAHVEGQDPCRRRERLVADELHRRDVGGEPMIEARPVAAFLGRKRRAGPGPLKIGRASCRERG